GEEDAENEPVVYSRRAGISRMIMRRGREKPVSNPPAKDPSAEPIPYLKDDKKPQDSPNAIDEKHTASFIDMIQRTLALAQFYAPHGIIPAMPHLPLPGIPNVPWSALPLPQIPIVFPVFVPALRGEK